MPYLVNCTNYDFPTDRFEMVVVETKSIETVARVCVQHHADHRLTIEVVPLTNFVETDHFNTLEFLRDIHDQMQNAIMSAIGEDPYRG